MEADEPERPRERAIARRVDRLQTLGQQRVGLGCGNANQQPDHDGAHKPDLGEAALGDDDLWPCRRFELERSALWQCSAERFVHAHVKERIRGMPVACLILGALWFR